MAFIVHNQGGHQKPVVIPTRSVDELLAVCHFLHGFPCQWWLGGGWAIDAWLGSQSRDHEDIEICVARQAQTQIYQYCADWSFATPKSGEWSPLPAGAWLEAPRFMLQLQRTQQTQISEVDMPPTFEFLLNEVDDGQWAFYRNPQIQLPLESIYERSAWGMLVTRPEILLLHKAVYLPRPKDDHDFRCVLSSLDQDRRLWLRDAIMSLHANHPWTVQLE
jgi:hypothetical protein